MRCRMGSLGLVDPEPFPGMLDRPSIAALVVRPIRTPIAAQPGDMLIAWPGHPTHTLGVVSPEPRRVLRTRHVPDGAVYGELLRLFLDAKIRLPLRSQRRLLTQAR